MGKAEVEKAEETNGQIDSNTKCNSNKQIVEKANERPEWLPDGWNVDIKTRKSGTHMGSGYKCYIDPVNGLKFYSKPEVLRYLETIKDNNSTSKKEKKCTNMHSPSNAVVEKSTEEDLPPGWIKEVKIRKNRNGIRKDPLFKDPVNGFVFRSKKDVLRYLESGDVGKCVFKPRRGQIQDEEKLTPLPAAKRQKLKKSASKQQFFAADEIFHKGTLELSDANSSRKGQDVKVPSEMMAAPVPTGESIVKMHSLEVGAANPPEIKKTSDPGSSALLKYESLKESEKGLSADDGQVKEHAVNMMENANEKNHHNHSISKNKEFNVRHRFSPRLAGIEPVQLANNVINEQTLQVPKRNLRKSRATLDADMENKSSQPFNGVQEIEQVHKMEQEVMNTSNNLSEGQTVFKEQPHLQETDKIEDKKPGIRTNSSKTRNKKAHNIPHRSSKRLAGFEHELNYISCENAPKYKSEKSEDKVNAELLQSGGKPVTEIADLAPINGESANKRRKSPKIPPFTDSQLEKLEDEEVVDEKSESQLSLAFHYSWSDPCLEFAINTLTGVLPPVEDSVDNGPTTVPETSIQKNLFDNVTGISRDSQNNLFDNVSRRSRDRNPQVHSNKSKRKKELKVPMRLSKRLAGLEPEVLPSERALEYSSRKCKEEPIPIATASDHLATVEKTKLNLHASDSLKTELLEESSNMTEKSYDAQTVPKEQLQNVEAENIGQERSEPQLPLPFGDSWSDPCFEFAIKTLTGALPVEAAVEILPVMTPDADMSNKDLHGSVVTSINAEGHDKSNQSQNKKELNMGTQPSELLMGQPMLRTSSTSCENAPKFTTGESCSHEGSIIRNLVGETVHIDAGNVTKLVHPSTNINTLMHEKPLKGNGQVVESEFVTIEQPPLETETIDHYNSEFPFCPSFMNSWSDPCLEFAFKTLTGDIPLEENFAIQGSLQESANCHERRDVGSTLTDVGSSSFSQSDVSFYYDIGLNSMPGQQSSMSTPILPLEKASLQGCPGVDPQKHYSQFNKDFRRRRSRQVKQGGTGAQ